MDWNALSLWLHCYSCLRSKDRSNFEMYTTNCGHFFCQNCVQKLNSTTPPKCIHCGVGNVKTIAIGTNLPSSMKHMFQNSINIPKAVHSGMDFQTHQMKITLSMFKGKADHMTRNVKAQYESCQASKQQGQEFDKEIHTLKNKLIEMEDRARQRSAAYGSYGQNRQTSTFPHPAGDSGSYRQAGLNQNINLGLKRPETPGFSGLEVNAFDPKTPDTFKQGKALIANAVTLQAMTQRPSPSHVRELFSPKTQDGFGGDNRRLSNGSSGGRIDPLLGMGKGRSPFNR